MITPPMSASILPFEVVEELLHSSSDASVVTDADGIIVFVNREAEQLFGYTAGEMLGEPVEILIPANHRNGHAKLREEYEEAPHARPLLSGLVLHGCRKDGSQFRAEIALTPVRTPSGVLVASTVRALQPDDASEAFFRTLLESAPDAMIIVDRRGRMAIANAQAERMFGYSRGELLGKKIEMLLPERMRGAHRKFRNGYVESAELRPMGEGRKLVGRRKDGNEFPVEISLSPAETSNGTFVSSVIRDVTERKRMEGEINEARLEAERANKANSAFLAAASHDLRQPVQALSLLNGALRRTVSDARALEMIESQEHSLTAMTNLLNSLLDISRLDAGAVMPEIEDFPIQRLVDRLSAEFGRQASHKGLVFIADSCPAVVRSDPNLLAEIIQNFVSNAIRYTETGSVRLSCSQADDQCRIEVRDTGIGIDEQELEAIFREFHQAKAPDVRNEGFGLGLAIVRRMADLLEHRVDVESTPGKGSCFAITVPRIERVLDADKSEAAESAGTGRAGAAGLVVLLEDDTNVASAWSMLLEAEGYEVVAARSLGEVDSAVDGVVKIPSLIISDYHLEDGSTGVQSVSHIRELYGESIPAFIVSGDTSKVMTDARPLENCTLMRKPVNTQRLLDAASTAVRYGRIPDS